MATRQPRRWEFWTDGSHVPQEPYGAGWAFIGWDLDNRRYACYGPHGKTNNQGELMAILKVLLLVKQYCIPGDSVYIHSDSEYSIKSLTEWIHGWKQRGWKNSKGAPVENQDLIKPIDEEKHQLLMRNIAVNFVKVKAHSGLENNELADRYANMGRSQTTLENFVIVP
jgi:ribonuclease HI